LPTSAYIQPSGQPLEGAETAPQDARHVARQDPSPRLGPGWPYGAAPCIAVYRDAQAPPVVDPLSEAEWGSDADGGRPEGEAPPESRAPGGNAARTSVPRLIELLTARSYDLAREQGGVMPVIVFRELIENLVHAGFSGVVITILDQGNTLRVSDQGPGIPDKEAALRPGFTSADSSVKQYIRGVGSGLAVARETLAGLGGALTIENNLGRGTVVTARVPPPEETPLTPTPAPEYNLPERQLKVLLLTVELAPVGPTRIAQELGVSTSTAYRDLVSLEETGFVVCRPSGHRSATDAGLAYLNAVL
jgi:anti-sigma regulatory factor (Ser/Thr protein kinase)